MANEFVCTYPIAGLGTITGEQKRNLATLGSAPMSDSSSDPGVYVGTPPSTPQPGDLFVYYDDGVPIDNETWMPEVDAAAVSGDQLAANNIESTYDGTGYNDGVAPATQNQVGSIANTGAAINTVSTGIVVDSATPVGVIASSSTYLATHANDGIEHIIVEDGNEIEVIYTFDVGGTGVPVSVTHVGRLYDPPGAGIDILLISAWDWVAGVWTQVGSEEGVNSSNNAAHTLVLFTNHVGTGADAGQIRIKYHGTGLGANTALHIDLLFCSFSVQASQVGYANGAIWVDTIDGVSGNEPYINGTADNPVLNWSEAISLSGQLGIEKFEISGGSEITLTENADTWDLRGRGWFLILNGKSCDNASFFGARVLGVCTGHPLFEKCNLDYNFSDGVTVESCTAIQCALGGELIFSTGTVIMDACFSAVAGTSTPHVHFDGDDAKNLNMRHWSGGIHIDNMGTGVGVCNMSLEGAGQLVIDNSCVDGTIAIRGAFTITDNTDSGFAGTISDDARFAVDQLIENEIDADAIVAALKSSDGWLTNTGSGTLTFKQIVTILTAWAAGKVEADGLGNFSVLDPEDDTTVIYKLTTVSKTSPYKDTDIG